MKKFLKKDQGFTLVELIVVIAILGILAGVGTVGYSGYIKKANLAADNQLVATINQAFAAACIENGVNHTAVTDADVVMSSDAAVTGITNVDHAKAAAIVESFAKYYAGNEGSKFKTIDSADELWFEYGMFSLLSTNDGGIFTQIFNALGSSIETSVSNVKNSTFGTIGAAGLMNKVDTVTGLAEALMVADASGTFKNALAMNMQTLAATMGFTAENDPDGSKFAAAYQDMVSKVAAQIDPENPSSADAITAAYNQIIANYAVLAAAQNTTQSSSELLSELSEGIKVDDIKNLLKGDGTSSQEGLSKAAMMYAMYTAYANQLPETTDEEKAAKTAALENAQTTSGFLAHMEDAEFKAYLSDSDSSAKTDLEGYLAALDIINQSAQGNADAVASLMVSGYNDPTLIAALQGLLG